MARVARGFLAPVELTERELAAWLGVTQQAVNGWKLGNNPCPVSGNKRGRATLYVLADVVAWLRERDKAETRAASEKPKQRQAEIDLRMSELDLAEREMEIAEKAGQLVPAAEVRRVSEEEAARVVAVLEQTPLQDAPLVSERANISTDDARALLTAVVRRQRVRLAAVRDEELDDEGDEAEAEVQAA